MNKTILRNICLILPFLLLALFAGDFLKTMGLGFFYGYSDSKVTFFAAILIITTIAFAFQSDFLKKYVKQIFILLIIIIAAMNIFSFFAFTQNTGQNILSSNYAVYDSTYSEYTTTSITHNHTFKPILAPFANLFNAQDHDFGLPILAFMPQYFNAVYLAGLLLVAAALIFSILVPLSLSKKEKSHSQLLFIWVYSAATYLVIKSLVDGGPFGTDFLFGFFILLLALTNRILPSKKNYLQWFLGLAIVILTDILIRIVVVSHVFKIHPALVVQMITNSLTHIGGMIVFTFGVAIVYHLIETKKIKKAVVVCIMLAAIMLGVIIQGQNVTDGSFQNKLFTNELRETVVIGEKILAAPEAVSPNACLSLIDGNREMYLYLATCNTTIGELSNWPQNLKSADYIFKWEDWCDYQQIPKYVYVRTNNEFTLIDKNGLIKIDKVDKCQTNACTYRIKFYVSYCIKDLRYPLTKKLSQNGLEQFILFQ